MIRGRRTWVYFIHAMPSNLIKIGVSVTPGERLSTFARSECAAQELTMLGTVRGDRALEKSLHDRFASLRDHGEWFRHDPTILAEMNRLGANLSEVAGSPLAEITTYLTPAMKREFVSLAKEHAVSVSTAVRWSVERWLESQR